MVLIHNDFSFDLGSCKGRKTTLTELEDIGMNEYKG